jgi:S-adenosyl-L-methionine hydrolase (adenosine-forming)
MTSPIITLLTDFGLRDPYVAEMKGVILGICSTVNIVDVSHDIEKFNVRLGAFVLASASRYFPKGTINVAVVDPGVGTERRGLCIETSRGFLIGPDNGVLVLAARTQGIEHIYVIENSGYFLPEVSHTFHGRDVFAPVAAHVANGVNPLNIGPETSKMIVPRFVKIVKRRKNVTGKVLYVDSFGNAITNITEKDLEGAGLCQESRLRVDGIQARLRFCSAYGEVEVGEPLALIGSHGFLEISVNQGDASKDFGLKIGDKITLRT